MLIGLHFARTQAVEENEPAREEYHGTTAIEESIKENLIVFIEANFGVTP